MWPRPLRRGKFSGTISARCEVGGIPPGVRPLAAALVLGIAASAVAAPVIDVRARTRILVENVTRTGNGVRVRGVLIDAGAGGGIAGRTVLLSVDGAEGFATTTSRAGRFDALAPAAAARVSVGARFDGDELYGESSFDPRPYDAGRAAVALELRVPETVDATATTTDGLVTAASEDGPVSVRVTLRGGDAGGPGTLRDVGEVTTDAENGVARIELPRERLGRPGEKRLLARFEGSDSLNPVEAEARFVLVTSTQLSDLELPGETVRFERKLEIGGKLLDAEGKPVSGGLVELLRTNAGEERVEEDITDARGRFTLRVAAADLGPGSVSLVVEHRSTVAWRRGTRSTPLVFMIDKPRPVPRWVTPLAFAMTLAAVGAYALLRTRPWLALAARWRARRRRPESAPDRPISEEEAPAPGLKLARPGLISTLRRAADHGFSGRVRDLVRGLPVAGARLVLWLDEQPQLELVADAEGHFETELGPGMWRVEVSAHGYVTETVTAPVPHRGELRGARIDLLPVRERVFALYRGVAAPLLPRPDLWGVWTPREIFDHARARRPAGAFGALTDLVEETYFGQVVPDESVVDETQRAVSAARAEI